MTKCFDLNLAEDESSVFEIVCTKAFTFVVNINVSSSLVKILV